MNYDDGGISNKPVSTFLQILRIRTNLNSFKLSFENFILLLGILKNERCIKDYFKS